MYDNDPGSWTNYPVLAVCGWKDSGKTTLLEHAIQHVHARSLRVGVVKHDAHGLDVDKAGSDSDRLFRAGADVILQGPSESIRRSRQVPLGSLEFAVHELLLTNDLVLVEGHKRTPLPKVWLTSLEDPSCPDGLASLQEVFPWSQERLPRFLAYVDRWLDATWRNRPRLGGVLIGGCSTRMGGHPKQLLRYGDRSLVEIAVSALEPLVDQVILLGSGEIPASLNDCRRLSDVRGLQGPLAGLLAAFRWSPNTAWCISACDLPFATADAMRWILDQRKPGTWAVLPRRSPSCVEPLFAAYEPQARTLLEALAGGETHSLQRLQTEKMVMCPSPPEHLFAAWTSVNTREEFSRLSRSA
ncbi:MAG: molybdopterin-guanine dinucleotide biosynthesis protein B [Bryobacteraceae bacterium]|nr:molybdopterin-guanine dinucleotide biosynthesis protein B [Bryobacteraceae bacterium]